MLFGALPRAGYEEADSNGLNVPRKQGVRGWARQDSNLGPTDYEFRESVGPEFVLAL